MNESSSWLRASLVSVVLGMSWTWCIGMFLPVLFLRDFGFPGFLVFAIPNVVGAAAMGWLIPSAERSRRIVRQHSSACMWFSLVTIAFHAFFAAWWIRLLVGFSAGYFVAGGFWVMLAIVMLAVDGPIWGAVISLLISASAFACGLVMHDLPRVIHHATNSSVAGALAAIAPSQLVWMAPVSLFGFLLCPWLDLTFHAARQSLDQPRARYAFSLGFGGWFALMLVFTMCYSGAISSQYVLLHPRIVMIVGAHWITQSCYTVALHCRQLLPIVRRIRLPDFSVFCALFLCAVALGAMSRRDLHHHGYALGEVVYRCFIGFYGLAFPAYVFQRIVPFRKQPPPASRRAGIALAACILIATPMYWLGFIERQSLWLLPGVAVALLARFALPASSGAILEKS